MSKEEEKKEEREKEKKPFPPQRGQLLFEGRKALQFRLRAFNLEAEIETVRELINAKPERKRAMVPIVADYIVDERLKFIFILQAQVDALGPQDGGGVVYWTSPEYEKEVYEYRDEQAKDLLDRLHTARKFDEIIELDRKGEE